MSETSIPNTLNHKPQTHSREPRVCEENKLEESEELEKMENILWLKDRLWKAQKKSDDTDSDNFYNMDCLHHKGNSTALSR